jgi:hypothetical protein
VTRLVTDLLPESVRLDGDGVREMIVNGGD